MCDRIFTILSSTWCWPSPTIGWSYIPHIWILPQHVFIWSSCAMNQAASKVTQWHWPSCWNTPLITLEEQSSIWMTIQAQTMARQIQDRRFSTHMEFQSGERVISEDKTPISWTIWSFMMHSRQILHSQGNGQHCILMRSCCILTFAISHSQRHSPSYWWLTFGWFRWFRRRVLTGDSQIFSTGWISCIITASSLHFKSTQLIALDSRRPPALNSPVLYKLWLILLTVKIITIIALHRSWHSRLRQPSFRPRHLH